MVDRRSKRVITRLALLFGLDSIGGGFLNSALIAYWFFRQYGTSEAGLALLFFAARVLNALSHVVEAAQEPIILPDAQHGAPCVLAQPRHK